MIQGYFFTLSPCQNKATVKPEAPHRQFEAIYLPMTIFPVQVPADLKNFRDFAAFMNNEIAFATFTMICYRVYRASFVTQTLRDRSPL